MATDLGPTSGPETTPRSTAQVATEWVQFLRTLVLSGAVIIAIAILIGFAVADILRRPVIIETFGLPPSLSERGFSGAVAAHRFWDAMTGIQDQAGTRKQTRALQAESRQLDVVEPASGLSLQGVTQMLRSLLRREPTRVAGEVICASDACTWEDLTLRLRIFVDGRMIVLNSKPIGDRETDVVFHAMALRALEIIDPYVLAAYHFEVTGDMATARKIAHHLIDTDHSQAIWAANLMGNIAQKSDEHDVALGWFDLAENIGAAGGERDFALPHYGRGNSLAAQQKFAEALKSFDRAIALERDFALAHVGRGQALVMLGDHEGAEDALHQAAHHDPEGAAFSRELGYLYLEMEKREAAVRHFHRVVRMAPSDRTTLMTLSNLLVHDGDEASAREIIEEALEHDPQLIYELDETSKSVVLQSQIKTVQTLLGSVGDLSGERIFRFLTTN